MIHDDFGFSFDCSGFPISIEEFAAYMDGNLSDDEMQRVSSVIDENKNMQEIIDSCDSIDESYDYNEFVGDAIIPDEIESMEFDVPNLDTININDLQVESSWDADVAACAEEPANLDFSVYEDESSYNSETLNVPEDTGLLSREGDSNLDFSFSSDTDIDVSFLEN